MNQDLGFIGKLLCDFEDIFDYYRDNSLKIEEEYAIMDNNGKDKEKALEDSKNE